jgi:hypothetical protein
VRLQLEMCPGRFEHSQVVIGGLREQVAKIVALASRIRPL